MRARWVGARATDRSVRVWAGGTASKWQRLVYHSQMDAKGAQRRQLEATIEWAHKLRATLQPILDEHGSRVHFRPSSKGIAMVSLLAERPQRGCRLETLVEFAANFEDLFAKHCRDVAHGRVTGEKALQSFLIREAYKHARHLEPINVASRITDEPVDLVFVTDEIALPITDGKTVCDVLALRRDGGRSTPVLLELKDQRQLTRLVEQVEGYAALVDLHANLFAELFAALLGEPVRFDAPAEKWIVWPAPPRPGADPQEDWLAARGVRVVGYTETDGAFALGVGKSVPAPLAKASAT